jgi:hypothetical protein
MKQIKFLPVLSLMAVLVIASACSGSSTTAINTEAPAVVATADPAAALVSSMKAQMALPAYSGNLVSEYKGVTTNAVVEFVSPDRYHVKTDTVEAILIGNVTYLNLNGNWSKMDIDLSGMVSSFRDTNLIESGISNVKYAGAEQVNGISTDAYTFTGSTNFNGQNLSAEIKAWISRADNLPVKIEVSGEVGGEKTFSTITYDYATKVSIEAPM